MPGLPHTDKQLSPDQLAVFRQAALILTSSMELDDALANAIGACLPFIGDFGFFDVVLQDGVRRTAGAHQDPGLQQVLAGSAWNRQERTDINLCALSSGQSVLHPNTDDAWFAQAFGGVPRTLAFHSMLSVPVLHGDELIGSLTLFMGRSGRHHSHADLVFAAELSSLAAPVVVKARLMAQQTQLNEQLQERVAVRTSERDRIWRMSKDILAVAQADGTFTAVNPSFTRLLGWSGHEAQSMPLHTLLQPDCYSAWASEISMLARGKGQSEIEGRWRCKDETFRWVAWTLVAEGDSIYCVGRDVTEVHKERAAVLNASEKRFQLALAVGGMGAWQWNVADDSVIWWRGMAELHGMPPGSQLRQVQDYLGLVHPDDRALAGRSLGGHLDENAGKGIEYRVMWPDGSIRWLEGRGEVTYNGQGQPVSMSGVCVDVTQRKLTEQRLQFLARVSGELAELVDHEETMARIAGLAVPYFADWCTVDLLSEAGHLTGRCGPCRPRQGCASTRPASALPARSCRRDRGVAGDSHRSSRVVSRDIGRHPGRVDRGQGLFADYSRPRPAFLYRCSVIDTWQNHRSFDIHLCRKPSYLQHGGCGHCDRDRASRGSGD